MSKQKTDITFEQAKKCRELSETIDISNLSICDGVKMKDVNADAMGDILFTVLVYSLCSIMVIVCLYLFGLAVISIKKDWRR